MGYDREQAEYYFFDEEYREAMEGPDAFYEHKDDEGQCGCSKSNIWFDKKLGIYRCRNCGWCS
jgi:hypothetical protein